MDALKADGGADLEKRERRMDGCCSVPEIRKAADGSPVVRLNACRDRLCPRCQQQRGLAVREKLIELVRKFNAPRFITLTLAHRETDLKTQRERAAECFREMRRQPEWRRHVKSGVWVIEITRNRESGCWHVHIHIIADGAYFPQPVISKVWGRVTGDSTIVDVRAVPDREKAVRYVADYVSKPAEIQDWSAEAICDFARGTHGARMVHTFGRAHGATVEAAEPEKERQPSEFVINTVVLARLARDGNAKAQYACNTFAAWRMGFAHAVGRNWEGNGSSPPLLGQRDVDAALRVCAELEAGRMAWSDEPKRPTPTKPRQAVMWVEHKV